jgi:hypothetical protein
MAGQFVRVFWPYEAYVSQGILAASFEYSTGGAEAVRVALDILNKKTVPQNI